MAIDPGLHTGLAIGNFESYPDIPEPASEIVLGFIASCWRIEEILRTADPPIDVVVIEKFTITSATAKKTQGGSNTAIEIIGVVRYLTQLLFEIPLFEQNPADAKNFVSDSKLKRVGWYVPGPDHARDALRHLLLAGVREQVFSPQLLLL